MKRWRVVFQDFVILDEGNVSDAQCFCFALGIFAHSHKRITQKWAPPASSPIAWQSSVDFEERMRQSTQAGRAFCCNSFGLSFL
jgi:hypothetical protein